MLRRTLFLAALVSLVAAAGCGGSSGAAPPAGAPIAGCGITMQGPLIGYTYQPPPNPPLSAGAVVDGTYDLVQIIKYTTHPGAWSSNMAPAFRWSMRLTTRDRSSNHTSGDVATALELPPAARCQNGRFATFQNELRFEGGEKGIESYQYTAAGDQLVILQPSGDGGVPHAYVFRRRP